MKVKGNLKGVDLVIINLKRGKLSVVYPVSIFLIIRLLSSGYNMMVDVLFVELLLKLVIIWLIMKRKRKKNDFNNIRFYLI